VTTPKLDERQRLLDGIADGTIAPRDIAGLSPADVEAIARLGASALVAKRGDVARRVFAARSGGERRQRARDVPFVASRESHKNRGRVAIAHWSAGWGSAKVSAANGGSELGRRRRSSVLRSGARTIQQTAAT
jgi:hypothetical protein